METRSPSSRTGPSGRVVDSAAATPAAGLAPSPGSPTGRASATYSAPIATSQREDTAAEAEKERRRCVDQERPGECETDEDVAMIEDASESPERHGVSKGLDLRCAPTKREQIG